MAAKTKHIFVCDECGYEALKWMGQCPNCRSWNTLNEKIVTVNTDKGKSVSINSEFKIAVSKKLSSVETTDECRFVTGIMELDRVLGGGIVKGSVVLLSGDPGIGKSTILLQICNALTSDLKILYVSGEESAVQIKLRAERLGVEGENVTVVTETDTMAICEFISREKPDMVMIDSIQTLSIPEISSSAGSIVQVRESTNMLLKTGKSLEIPIFIVGHVNKGGDIAGPKVLEHIVDTVLYFEGERNQSYRILRAIKNRFGSTNEIGVFEMTERGLSEVENPSAMLLSGRLDNVSGGCITCIIEGTRPILVEVQSLVATTGFGTPRRMSTGYDYNRLNMVLAVLEKRMGLHYSNLDTYLNIVGGMRIDEPAADLAVCMAAVSALRDKPIDASVIVFGEIGLSGEIRGVSRIESRINESARLGFKKCIVPKANLKKEIRLPSSIEVIGVGNLADVLRLI